MSPRSTRTNRTVRDSELESVEPEQRPYGARASRLRRSKASSKTGQPRPYQLLDGSEQQGENEEHTPGALQLQGESQKDLREGGVQVLPAKGEDLCLTSLTKRQSTAQNLGVPVPGVPGNANAKKQKHLAGSVRVMMDLGAPKRVPSLQMPGAGSPNTIGGTRTPLPPRQLAKIPSSTQATATSSLDNVDPETESKCTGEKLEHATPPLEETEAGAQKSSAPSNTTVAAEISPENANKTQNNDAVGSGVLDLLSSGETTEAKTNENNGAQAGHHEASDAKSLEASVENERRITAATATVE